jgi:hypothetical protein
MTNDGCLAYSNLAFINMTKLVFLRPANMLRIMQQLCFSLST